MLCYTLEAIAFSTNKNILAFALCFLVTIGESTLLLLIIFTSLNQSFNVPKALFLDFLHSRVAQTQSRSQSPRAFTVSGIEMSCILGADQKECSLWERDWLKPSAQNITGNASAFATGSASDPSDVGKDVGRKPRKPILLSIQEIKMSATIVRY